MKKVQITCDSTTDLGDALRERFGFAVLPLWTGLGEEYYKDGVDVHPDQLFEYHEKTGQLPKTTSPNIAEAETFFRSFAEQGMAVVHFTLSSEMSSSYQNAVVASESFDDVFVVDSRNLSTGGGLLVLHACDLAAAGKSAAEIADECRALTGQVDASFIIGDLTYLKEGGRCSSVAAFGANLLNIKPLVQVSHGEMSVPKKYRGKFDRVLMEYISDKLGDGSGLDLSRIFVTYASTLQEDLVEPAKEAILKIAPFQEVLVTRAGSTICSHCGPVAMGILFMHDHDI